MRGLVSSLLMLFLFVACQAKEGDSSSGLISGHLPTTNKFTVQTPTSKTFVAGETITISVSYPFDMIIDTTGGSPQLNITVGATARVATYSAGADPRILTFTYTVVAAENDTNGITVNSLSLNGSTIQFDNNGTLTNADVTTVTSKTLSGIKVDTAGPTITGFALTNMPGFYNVGEAIQYTMTFSEPVILTGTPKFITTLSTGGAIDTNYISGSGTSILRFSFTISSSYADSDGYAITSPLDIGAGTLKDAVGNDANLNFLALVAAVQTYSSGVKIGGQYPYIETVSLPANGTYLAGDDLDINMVFDRLVNVSGTPYINLTIGSTTLQAQYVSGTGTDTLTFRYTVIPGDIDADGITVAASITANGGDIQDAGGTNVSFFGDVLNNSYTVPSTSGIIVNALQPMATSVTRSTDTTLPIFGGATADNVWNIGQVIYITVGFNTNVTVSQVGGTPTLSMAVGAATRQAPYLGGSGQSSLVFSYTIQEGDLDTDNTIVLNGIVLNGGVIADAQNTNILLTMPANLTSTKFDGVRPTINSVSPPANGTYSGVAPLNNMPFVINWSEAVNYSSTAAAAAYFPVDIGGVNVNAICAGGNNTATVTHTVNFSSKNDSNGVTVSSPFAGTATIRDAAGNAANVFTFTPPDTSLVLVDTTSPTVVSVTQTTPDGTYKAGETLDFLVTFNETVTTQVAGGYPRIPITIGATTRYLVPTANATSTTHTFRYTIVAGEVDIDGVAVGTSITHNATTAYARDGGRNNSTGLFASPNTPLLKVDSVVPTISSRTAPTLKAYVSGETISLSVTYSEAITVDTTGGTPYIGVDFSVGTDNLNYASGSGTSTLVFSRTLDGTHFDMDGLNSSVTTITPNGGTLQDAGRNNAPTTFVAVALSAVYVTYPEVKLWTNSSFANIAPPAGAVTIANAGGITTAACGTSGTCRIFTGDDALNLTGTLTGVETVFHAFRTPAAVASDHDLFSTDVYLKAMGGNWDIFSVASTITLNGTTYNLNDTTHNTNMATSTMYVMQTDYQNPQNYNAENLIPTSFTGYIGEVIAVEGTLDGTQKSNILNYLDTKY